MGTLSVPVTLAGVSLRTVDSLSFGMTFTHSLPFASNNRGQIRVFPLTSPSRLRAQSLWAEQGISESEKNLGIGKQPPLSG